MSSSADVLIDLRPDERQMLTLMRKEARPNVDFTVCRREGRIVKMEASVVHIKEFKTENLPATHIV